MTGATPLGGLAASILDVSHAGEFLSKFTELYLDSFLANVMIGVLLGSLGLFVILRRIVFLSAALSQVSGAGLALAFFLGAIWAHQEAIPGIRPVAPPDEKLENNVPEDDADRDIQNFLDDDESAKPRAKSPPSDPKTMGAKTLTGPAPMGAIPPDRPVKPPLPPKPGKTAPPMATGPPDVPTVSPAVKHGRHEPIRPIFLSLILTALVALLLSESGRGQRRMTQESVVGLVFILASAASIILAQLAEKGAHEIAELLFGTVIFIPPGQQYLIYGVGAVTLVIYAVLFKDFVFVSFDPTSARASGFPVRLTNGMLFLLIAVSIAICTRAVGAMPVFALTVLPPAAALLIHDRMLPAMITSAGVGAVAAAGGYFLSGLLNLSAGPLIVIVGSLIVGVTWLVRTILNKVVALRARRQSEQAG
ncbi:MAG: metal ABC transporter permease [bacterium]